MYVRDQESGITATQFIYCISTQMYARIPDHTQRHKYYLVRSHQDLQALTNSQDKQGAIMKTKASVTCHIGTKYESSLSFRFNAHVVLTHISMYHRGPTKHCSSRL